jgi:glycosyltransferase involved in cell wall biosynthesis
MFEREVALYRRLQERGAQIGFVTYGGAADLTYADRLPGIRILCNHWGLPERLYEWALPSLHGSHLRRASLFKTNQTNGAEVALRSARLFRKPLIARCGYMWSDFVVRQHGLNSATARRAFEMETKVFSSADRIVVTTDAMQQNIIRRIPSATKRIVVIPNYVDTDVFHPFGGDQDEKRVIFVGRLTPQKNVTALLEAIEPLEVELSIIGVGELRPELQDRFGSMSGRLHWLGNVPNSDLPTYLNRAALFVLPSHYEGHPKAMIEAMACGLPVLGADSPGIRELIRHGETGWLCGTDSSSIRMAIEELMAMPQLRTELGKSARQWVMEEFALDRIAQIEFGLLTEVSRL